MKRIVLTLGLILLALPSLAGDHPAAKSADHPADHPADHSSDHPMATKSGWFDMENCAFCKNLLTDPDLLEHMTWETHKTDNGMMYVTTCEPEYRASYDKCNQAIEKLGNDMMTGKVNPRQVEMCGSCAGLGPLMMVGVKVEEIHGEAADIMLFSSDDPALIAKLHDYADRNKKEMAEMMASSHKK